MTLFAQNERNRSISHRQLMQMLYVSAGSRIFFLLVIVIALIQLYFTRRKEVQQ